MWRAASLAGLFGLLVVGVSAQTNTPTPTITPYPTATPMPFNVVINEMTWIVTGGLTTADHLIVALIIMGAGMWLMRRVIRGNPDWW